MRDLSYFDEIPSNMETGGGGLVTNSPHGLLLHRQSFYLRLRFHRNCCVSDNSVCVVGKKRKRSVFVGESSQTSLFSSEPDRPRLDYNYQ